MRNIRARQPRRNSACSARRFCAAPRWRCSRNCAHARRHDQACWRSRAIRTAGICRQRGTSSSPPHWTQWCVARSAGCSSSPHRGMASRSWFRAACRRTSWGVFQTRKSSPRPTGRNWCMTSVGTCAPSSRLQSTRGCFRERGSHPMRPRWTAGVSRGIVAATWPQASADRSQVEGRIACLRARWC